MIDIAKYRERAYPYLGGLIAAGLALAYGPAAAEWSAAKGVQLKDFFSAVFDVATVLTAFLFAFFGIAIAPGGGFIERIFRTQTFRLFLRYMGEALALGAVLVVGSIPFMIADIKPASGATAQNIAVAGWTFVCISATLAFYRVASVFLIWIRASSASGRAVNPRSAAAS